MAIWFLWAGMLLLQNASFTWVSRARNSSSVGYHALASVFSNGVWLLSQFVLFNQFVEAKNRGGWFLVAVTVFYVVFTVLGSVGAHAFLMKHVERGGRKVGQ